MIKKLACLLLFFSSPLFGQSLESTKAFDEASAAASKGSGVLFVLATAENCAPCESAKQIIGADVRLVRHTVIELPIEDVQKLSFGGSRLLPSSGSSGGITFSRRILAPKLLLIDVGDVIADLSVVEAGSITRESIDHLLGMLPVELLSPVILEFKEEPPTFGAASRIIKYAIATQYKNGAYNSTFEWGKIDRYLTAFERYWDVDFQRVTRGENILFLQSNKNLSGGPTVAARAGGSTVSISPTFNFGNGPWCGLVTLHETGHLYGGSSHNRDANGLMGVSAGKGSIIQSDYAWFRQWKWKAGTKKPHEEPEWLMQWITGAITASEPGFKFECPER